jgi:DNA-binding LacI/PurR family transcriptional regulator
MVARGLVDAMIISSTHRHDARIELLNRAKIPFIALGRSMMPGKYPWIDLDFEGVAERAIDRLVANGHDRIALGLPSNDINLGFVFHDGYKAALERNGISYDPSLVMRVQSSELGGYQLGRELLSLEPRPTAVLLVYELMALGLYRKLSETGLRAGKDLGIIGFRESPLTSFLSPRLTCFRISLRDLGMSLAEALLSSMPAYADLYPQGLVNKIWSMELIPGESDLRN